MKKSQHVKIGKYTIGEGYPAFIIAEAGINHNGSIALAKQLIDAAKAAGADAVKFQNFKAEEVTTRNAGMAEYQKRNTGTSEAQIEMIRKLELSDEEFEELFAYCEQRDIMFLSTPHGGFSSVDLLRKLGVPAYKFGSGDLDNFPVIDYAARQKKPMLIATGMANLRTTEEAVRCIRKAGNNAIVVFQCTTDYPTAYADVNMRAMQTIRDTCKVIVGYSDHTIGSLAAIVAVSQGAHVLEKHFTLDNAMEGPDHTASANPEDFKKYVRVVRDTETILGSPKKFVAGPARQYVALVFKSLVARTPIRKGEKFTKNNLAIKRPQGGLPPKFYFAALGKKASRNIKADEFIRKTDFIA